MNSEVYYHPKMLRVHLFEITQCAEFAEYDLAHLLRRPEQGIYSRATSDLLISSRNTGIGLGKPQFFYHEKKNRQFVPVNKRINCIEDIQGPVYNADLEPVITIGMLKEPGTFLTEAPLLPVNGLLMVETYVKHYVDDGLRWKGWSDMEWDDKVWFDLVNIWQQSWRDPYQQASELEFKTFGKNAMPVLNEAIRRLTDALTPLLEAIDRVLAGDNQEWAIVNVKRNVNKLRIQIFEDYRVCEWMNEHDQGRNLQSLEVCDETIGDDIGRLWSNV